MDPPSLAAIGLGANLGDRVAGITLAIERIGQLESTELGTVSSMIETAPVGVEDQPQFLNACCLVRTGLLARRLLSELHRIERELGRDRPSERRWGPRLIDLDLLLFDDLILDEPGLTIPHPRMHERRFVLDPLAEIAAGWVQPVLARTILELRDRLVGGSALPVDANLLA